MNFTFNVTKGKGNLTYTDNAEKSFDNPDTYLLKFSSEVSFFLLVWFIISILTILLFILI